MAKANCRTIMFGIESGSQKILDRLKKEQTLEEVETAVTNAKQAGIEIVHGFFVVGNPDETVEDMRATFDFASRLRLDTFGFNRLCVYRGTPLWQEYVKRGLVNDATRLVQVLQVLRDRSDLPAGRGDPSRAHRRTAPAVRLQAHPLSASDAAAAAPLPPASAFDQGAGIFDGAGRGGIMLGSAFIRIRG